MKSNFQLNDTVIVKNVLQHHIGTIYAIDLDTREFKVKFDTPIVLTLPEALYDCTEVTCNKDGYVENVLITYGRRVDTFDQQYQVKTINEPKFNNLKDGSPVIFTKLGETKKYAGQVTCIEEKHFIVAFKELIRLKVPDDNDPYGNFFTFFRQLVFNQTTGKLIEGLDEEGNIVELYSHLGSIEVCESVSSCSLKNELTKKEKNKMERRTVTVQLFDEDKGLDVQYSLVGSWENVITEDDDATTIQEQMMQVNMKEVLENHNAIRTKQIDLDILNRTGNEVTLREVKLKDLTWKVTD